MQVGGQCHLRVRLRLKRPTQTFQVAAQLGMVVYLAVEQDRGVADPYGKIDIVAVDDVQTGLPQRHGAVPGHLLTDQTALIRSAMAEPAQTRLVEVGVDAAENAAHGQTFPARQLIPASCTSQACISQPSANHERNSPGSERKQYSG